MALAAQCMHSYFFKLYSILGNTLHVTFKTLSPGVKVLGFSIGSAKVIVELSTIKSQMSGKIWISVNLWFGCPILFWLNKIKN